MKTPNIKMRKLAFRISSTKDWQYSHVTIDILAPKYNWSEAGELESLLSLRWQSDKDNGFDKWYGLSVSFESRDSSPENIAAQIALASRTFAKVLPASSDSLPATVILQLAAMKVDRVAHDSRLSRYVSQAEMPSIALTRWMDDYDATGNRSGCTVACLALDSSHAQELLAKEWAGMITSHCGATYQELFAKWINAGRPVKQCEGRYYQAAAFPSIDSLLNTADSAQLAIV